MPIFTDTAPMANLQGNIDLLPCGLPAMRRALELVIDYAFEQKLLPRKLTIDELFDDATHALGS